jgi:hypothetical protein
MKKQNKLSRKKLKVLSEAKEKANQLRINAEKMNNRVGELNKHLSNFVWKDSIYEAPEGINQRKYEKALYNNLRIGIDAETTHYAFKYNEVNIQRTDSILKGFYENGIECLKEGYLVWSELTLPPSSSEISKGILKLIKREATEKDIEELAYEVYDRIEFEKSKH